MGIIDFIKWEWDRPKSYLKSLCQFSFMLFTMAMVILFIYLGGPIYKAIYPECINDICYIVSGMLLYIIVIFFIAALSVAIYVGVTILICCKKTYYEYENYEETHKLISESDTLIITKYHPTTL